MQPRLERSALNEVTTSLISAVMIALGPVSLALYTPALPELVNAFHATPAAVRSSLTIYFLGFCLAQLVCGPMSDAFGRRKVALIFFTIYLFGSVVCVLAPSIHWLQAGRALQGIGAAAGVSTSRAIVRDLFVGQASARIMNRIGLLVAVVPALSPAAGSVLLTFAGWQSIFVVMLFYAIVVVATVAFIVPETNTRIDPGLARPGHIATSYMTLFGDRRFMGPSLIFAFVLGGVYTLPSLMPFVLIDRLGLTPLQYGVVMITQTAALIVANLIVGRLLRRVNARSLIPVGLAIIGLGGLGYLLLWLLHWVSVASVLIPGAIWAAGIPFVSPGTMTSALSHFPRIAGAAAALIGFMQMGGGLLGSAVASGLFHDPLTALGVVLPMSAALAALSYVLMPGEPPNPTET